MNREEVIRRIAAIDWHTGRTQAVADRTAARIFDDLNARGVLKLDGTSDSYDLGWRGAADWLTEYGGVLGRSLAEEMLTRFKRKYWLYVAGCAECSDSSDPLIERLGPFETPNDAMAAAWCPPGRKLEWKGDPDGKGVRANLFGQGEAWVVEA